MPVSAIPTLADSVLASVTSARALVSRAATQVATGDPDLYPDAAMEMSDAKMAIGLATLLERTQERAFQNMLDMLV